MKAKAANSKPEPDRWSASQTESRAELSSKQRRPLRPEPPHDIVYTVITGATPAILLPLIVFRYLESQTLLPLLRIIW